MTKIYTDIRYKNTNLNSDMGYSIPIDENGYCDLSKYDPFDLINIMYVLDASFPDANIMDNFKKQDSSLLKYKNIILE